MSSRWKYKTAKVTVGDNSQTVRMLTAGEHRQFSEASSRIKSGEFKAAELPSMIAKMGSIDPTLSDQDVAEMPVDLMQAVVEKIFELTGIELDKTPAVVGGEKKSDELPNLNS